MFAEIDARSLCISTESILEKINPRTKAVVSVHYAGTSHNIDEVADICKKHGIYLIEDAAQSIFSFYKKRPLGSFGDVACFSFHETKNITCGEAGMVLIKDSLIFRRAR